MKRKLTHNDLRKIVVSFGGGVNSTAMLLGLYDRGEPVDLILFSDTGAEKPETYSHRDSFNEWLLAHKMPEIITVREEKRTLEQECLENHTLPSIVVGIRSCSDKYKIRPQRRYLKSIGVENPMRLIGFDAGEGHRVVDDPLLRFPLIEWEWYREECVDVIQKHGLQVPLKSSCFFCPEMKEWEILELQAEHPDLVQRAMQMEKNNTSLTTIKGLGRTHNWKQVIEFHKNQGDLFLMPRHREDIPCMCFDGE